MTKAIKTPQERIDELEHRINNTREELNEKLLALESELNILRASIQTDPLSSFKEDVSISTAYTMQQGIAPVLLAPAPVEQEVIAEDSRSKQIEPGKNKVTINKNHDEWQNSQTTSASDWAETVSKGQPEPPSEPGFLSVFLSKFFITIFSFILSRLTLFIAPFQGLTHKLIKLYQHYKAQGKAPVFLMTVAGLLTLTVGFGYLLQYSFHTLFNDVLKAVTGFVIGAGIIGAGALLASKKTDFREYAASVVALGVIFNYLTAYFIGPYYGIVSETTGFILLMAVTLLSFGLALIYETRVVSFVTLVGGVLMPFIMGDLESLGLVFLLYLFFLSCGNLYLSHKIKWPSLSHITFVLSLSVIEYIGISKEVNPLVIMLLLSGFFYMYTYYGSFQGVKIKENLSRYDLTILVSNVFYFIYAMLQVTTSSLTIASVLIFHAILLGVFVFGRQLLNSVLAPVFFLMIGLLIATSVFVLAPVDVTSIIWAIEGLVLVYIGFQYQHRLIRAEGYAIYLIAMLGLLWHVLVGGAAVSSDVMSWYWINLAAFGLLSFTAYRLIGYFQGNAEQVELKAAVVQNEIFTFWGAGSLSFVLAFFVPEMLSVLLVIPMVWCFYRVAKFRLRFAQLIGFYLFLSFVVNILAGMVDAKTTVISQQLFTSWILIAEMLFFSWSLHFYYQRFDLHGRGRQLAAVLHQLVFYIPVTLLGLSLVQITIHYLVEQKPLAFSYVWLDFIIIGILLLTGHWVVNKTESIKENEPRLLHQYILSETGSLYLTVFFLYSMAILFKDWMFTAASIPLLLLLHRSVKDKLPLTEKLAWAHFLIFAVMTWLGYQVVGNLHFTEQSLSTQIAWGEVLFCAWAMKMIYDRLDSKQGGYELAVKVRTGVYLLLPLLFLPRIFRLYTEYVPVFIWFSFAISWLMYKKLKIKPLLNQLTILFFVAVVTTVLMALNAVTGIQALPGLVALITGVVVITLFHYVEKTLNNNSSSSSIYTKIELTSPYFYGFALAAFTYALTNLMTPSLLVAVIFFLFLIQERRLRIVMRPTLKIAYLLIWSGLIAIPLLVFMRVEQHYLVIVVDLIAILGLWYVTHQRQASLIYMQKNHVSRNAQFWAFHGLVFVGYTGVLNLVFEPWSVGTSIVMLMHAVIVLFLTLMDDYKSLLRLSIVLYALTAVKVLFHDMNDFSHIHKVIALMCMGSILMLAAYLFQKVRNTRVISTC